MKTQNVTNLLTSGEIKEFQEIFKVYHYSRKIFCNSTGIGKYRTNTIIEDTGKMRPPELFLIAEHFNVPWEVLLNVVGNQIKRQHKGEFDRIRKKDIK